MHVVQLLRLLSSCACFFTSHTCAAVADYCVENLVEALFLITEVLNDFFGFIVFRYLAPRQVDAINAWLFPKLPSVLICLKDEPIQRVLVHQNIHLFCLRSSPGTLVVTVRASRSLAQW